MYTSSVYCFVSWLKCRHTSGLTVKQQDQLQEWCGCGASRPPFPTPSRGLRPGMRQAPWSAVPLGSRCRFWRCRGSAHPGGCPWAANLSRLPVLVAHSPPAAPAGKPAPAPPLMHAHRARTTITRGSGYSDPGLTLLS